MSDKDIAIQEMSKTMNRLASRGVDTRGLSFYYRENIEDEPGKVLWNHDENFIKVFPGEIARMAEHLSGPETIIILMIMQYISYESGMLTKGGGYPLQMADIERMTDYTKRQVISCMDKLVKKRVLARTKVGKAYKWFANPYIFFRGKYINKTLTAMFKGYMVGG